MSEAMGDMQESRKRHRGAEPFGANVEDDLA